MGLYAHGASGFGGSEDVDLTGVAGTASPATRNDESLLSGVAKPAPRGGFHTKAALLVTLK